MMCVGVARYEGVHDLIMMCVGVARYEGVGVARYEGYMTLL